MANSDEECDIRPGKVTPKKLPKQSGGGGHEFVTALPLAEDASEGVEYVLMDDLSDPTTYKGTFIFDSSTNSFVASSGSGGGGHEFVTQLPLTGVEGIEYILMDDLSDPDTFQGTYIYNKTLNAYVMTSSSGTPRPATIGRWVKINEYMNSGTYAAVDLTPYSMVAISPRLNSFSSDAFITNSSVFATGVYTDRFELSTNGRHNGQDWSVSVVMWQKTNPRVEVTHNNTTSVILYGYKETALTDDDVQKILDGIGTDRTRIRQVYKSFDYLEVPPITQDIASLDVARVDFSLTEAEAQEWALAGILAYEFFDAEPNGKRLNIIPVSQYTQNNQRQLTIRIMVAGSNRKVVKRANVWLIMRHR